MDTLASKYIFNDRPALGWTVEHTAYPPLEAESNLETILVRCPEEPADCAVCHEVLCARENVVSQSHHRKAPVPMLDTLGRTTKEATPEHDANV